jgi:hypothetical protein
MATSENARLIKKMMVSLPFRIYFFLLAFFPVDPFFAFFLAAIKLTFDRPLNTFNSDLCNIYFIHQKKHRIALLKSNLLRRIGSKIQL